jgi:hypothetical protein
MGAASPMSPSQGRIALLIAAFLAGWLGALASAYGQKPDQHRGLTDVSPALPATTQSTSYYALVVGNNDYQYLHHLQTAVNDADAVAQLLKTRYGFETKILHDATRKEVIDALNFYMNNLPENSNLLIYFAGHGSHDRRTDKAYWLPTDAQSDNNGNWISADDITSDVRAVPSQHVLIISDSCYSGGLTRGEEYMGVTPRRDVYLKKMSQSKSRTLMSSGGDEPVADGGAGGHSIFAGVVLDSLLRIEDNTFTAAELFQRFIQPGVAGRSQQVPQYSLIRNADTDGDFYGDFVFSRLNGSGSWVEPPPVDHPISEKITTAGDRQRIPITPPLHPVDPEADAIFTTIHGYEDAYETMDVNVMKAVWPSLSKKQIDLLKAGFKGAQAVKVQVQLCSPVATNIDTAHVSCTQAMAYTRDGRRQPAETNPVEISLKKAPGGRWVVEEVRVR